MNKPLIYVIMGSTRENRKSERVGTWIMDTLKDQTDADIELIDLRDYPLPFYEEAETPSDIKGSYKSNVANQWKQKISTADGFIFALAEYNHGIPAVLKNALDYIYAEWNKKPMAIVSYGGPAGGARSAEQLRLVSIELQMAPVEKSIVLTRISKQFNEDGTIADPSYNKRLLGVWDDLMWWTKALKTAREAQ